MVFPDKDVLSGIPGTKNTQVCDIDDVDATLVPGSPLCFLDRRPPRVVATCGVAGAGGGTTAMQMTQFGVFAKDTGPSFPTRVPLSTLLYREKGY